MNVENLKNNYPKLLSHMEDSGYERGTFTRSAGKSNGSYQKLG